MKESGALIKNVDPESIGAEVELEPGDLVLTVNGIPLQDTIDYLFLTSDETVELEIHKKNGSMEQVEIEKEPGEPLGIQFEDAVFDGIKECHNHCLFCFVHQLPAGQRSSLYIKDDDYRLSFLQGAYITLTNLTESDWQRIERLHLSPLYVSVHATDLEVRRKLLGLKDAGSILEQLQRLVEAGITIHTQAVICPGINDGPVLEKTIADLAALWPGVASLAVVPVGLTSHRGHLFRLRGFTAAEASLVIGMIEAKQREYLERLETRFVFAADEWYVNSGRPVPPDENYEDYLQLDNGVGLIRWFLTDFYESFPLFRPLLAQLQGTLGIITGRSALACWEEIRQFFRSEGLPLLIEAIPVDNFFLGTSVTVTGLLSGKDIETAIRSHHDGVSCYQIPQITLKQGTELFLDGTTVTALTEACRPKTIAVVPTRARDWLNWIAEKGCVDGCLTLLSR
jgi:putative radical SAM enzyme (TIGR03279 family)